MLNPSDKSEGEGVAGYTPGPWVVRASYSICGPRVEVAFATGNSVDDKTRSANARLIAAAPDLAEALLTLADEVSEGVELWTEIEAALKKSGRGTAKFKKAVAKARAALSRLTKE